MCLRDEQAAYKQGSVHVKARSRNVCHIHYIRGVTKRRKRQTERTNCSDWPNFILNIIH